MFAALKAWHDSRYMNRAVLQASECRTRGARCSAVVSGQLVLLTLAAVPVWVQSTGDGDDPTRLGEMVGL